MAIEIVTCGDGLHEVRWDGSEGTPLAHEHELEERILGALAPAASPPASRCVERIASWLSAGVDVERFVSRHRAPVGEVLCFDDHEVAKYAALGVEGSDANRYFGVASVDQLLRLDASGVDLSPFEAVGLRPSRALLWAATGLDPDEVRQLLDAGRGPHEALTRREMVRGLRPSRLQRTDTVEAA